MFYKKLVLRYHISVLTSGRIEMKRIVVLSVVLLISLSSLVAAENFFGDLTQAQRYDLADSYNRVADRYQELDDTQKAQSFRAMVEVIFPGFGKAERPQTAQTAPKPVAREEKIDPSGDEASRYYFNKILRGIFNENLNLTVSVLAETLYLPLYDSGLSKADVSSEIEWFFDNYDLSRIAPNDVLDMNSIRVTALDNGYWRLDVKVRPEYRDALPEVTFWGEKMGMYFRKYPEGWRLGAIGPVA